MGDARHHGEHKPEAMEEGDGDAELICRGELHTVADGLAVVEDVVVGQHNPLGESRRTGGVLHIDNIMTVEPCSRSSIFGVTNRLCHGVQILPVIHPRISLLINGDAGAQEGETGAAVITRIGLCGKLGAETVDDIHIADILEAVAHDQHLGIRLLEQILCLVNFIRGIDSNQHCADFGTGKQRHHPLRVIGCPDGNMIAALDAHCKKSTGNGIALGVKFSVCALIVEFVGIDNGRLIGVFGRDLIHPFTQCCVDKFHIQFPLFIFAEFYQTK